MSLLQIARYSRLVGQIGKASGWSKEKIDRVQQKRLRRLLSLAQNHSPFYREKFRGLDIGSAPLSRFPITTKDEIRDHFNSVVTDRNLRRETALQFMEDDKNLGRWLLGRYGVSHTSGTQGAPLIIVQDRQCLETMFALSSCRASVVDSPGIAEGIRRMMNPKKIAIVTFRRGFFPSNAAFEFMESIVGRFVNVARFSSTQPDLIEALHTFQPEVLVSYASTLDGLATQALRLQLNQLKQISNSSEQLRPATRQRIEQAFGTPLLDHYGAGECLFLAEGCRDGNGMHVNADWAILEVVDARNQPVPDGELGDKILVTNLANQVQPFIRYEIGDRVRMATEPCSCGSPFPRMEQIEGRSADLFWIEQSGRKTPVPGVLLHVAMDESHSIRQWQAIQVAPQQIVFRLVTLDESTASSEDRHRILTKDELLDFLPKKLSELGLPPSTQLDFQFVGELKPDPNTGKLKQVVSQVHANVN